MTIASQTDAMVSKQKPTTQRQICRYVVGADHDNKTAELESMSLQNRCQYIRAQGSRSRRRGLEDVSRLLYVECIGIVSNRNDWKQRSIQCPVNNTIEVQGRAFLLQWRHVVLMVESVVFNRRSSSDIVRARTKRVSGEFTGFSRQLVVGWATTKLVIRSKRC